MIYNTLKHKLFNKISFSYVKKRNFVRLVEEDLKYKKRHHAPAIKEWSNSTYSFNKSYAKDLIIKDLLADRTIKEFFYLVKKSKYTARSRRMRNLRFKIRNNRLYLSKPEIKQTNDKSIITVYNYDREKEYFMKKFFYYKRLIKTSLTNKSSFSKKELLKKQFLLKSISLAGRKLKLEVKLYEKKLFNTINKFKLKKKDFFFKYLFFKWILQKFYLKIDIVRLNNKLNNKKSKFLFIRNTKFLSKYVENILIRLGFTHKTKRNMSIILFENNYFKSKHIHVSENNYILEINNITTIKNINMILYVLVAKLLNREGFGFYEIYRKYYKIYYKRFLKILLLKKTKLNRVRKFYINNTKFTKHLPLLKFYLNKIYNKKIEINLINLKYPYLSSDILVNTLATKLRDRTRSLAIVVKRYLGFIRLIKLSSNAKGYINTGNNESYIINKEKNTTTRNVIDLTNIKSKWITGMRLETAGRLTNRYVAQRSVYKYRNRGNLKSMYHKPINIRTYIGPNIQKSYVQSKRLIGAFGIKGWISSN